MNRFTEVLEQVHKFAESYPALPVPQHCPWGTVQGCTVISNGIYEVSTPGHGGVMIDENVAGMLLSPEARKIGFVENGFHCFEEDADAQVPLRELMDKGIMDREQYFQDRYHKSYEELGEWWNAVIDDSIMVCHHDYWSAHANVDFQPRKAISPDNIAVGDKFTVDGKEYEVYATAAYHHGEIENDKVSLGYPEEWYGSVYTRITAMSKESLTARGVYLGNTYEEANGLRQKHDKAKNSQIERD